MDPRGAGAGAGGAASCGAAAGTLSAFSIYGVSQSTHDNIVTACKSFEKFRKSSSEASALYPLPFAELPASALCDPTLYCSYAFWRMNKTPLYAYNMLVLYTRSDEDDQPGIAFGQLQDLRGIRTFLCVP